MPTVSIKAHYDGERIQLDEPFDLPTDARLIVTVLPSATDSPREEWAEIGKSGLAGAYGNDEPEYTIGHVKRR